MQLILNKGARSGRKCRLFPASNRDDKQQQESQNSHPAQQSTHGHNRHACHVVVWCEAIVVVDGSIHGLPPQHPNRYT